MYYLLLFLSLTGWSLIGARATQNIAYGPIWGQATLAILIYLCALVGLLLPGTLALGAVGLVYLGGSALYRRGWRQKDLHAVVASCALIFGLSVWHSRGMQFFSWDEFSHWGLQIKWLHETHALQTQSWELVFPDYIPGMSLYRYLGALADPALEQGASLVNWFLTYCCVLAAAGGVVGSNRGATASGRGQWNRAAAIWLLCFTAYYFFFQNLVATMYVDGLLGLLFLTGMLSMCRARHQPQPVLYMAPILVFMVLTKHVGIVLACMVIGMGVLTLISEKGRQALHFTHLKTPAALLGLCLVAAASWKLYVSVYALEPHFTLNKAELFNDSEPLWDILLQNLAGILQNYFPHAAYLGDRPPSIPEPLRHLWALIAAAMLIGGLLVASSGPRARRPLLWQAAYLMLCLCAYLAFLTVVRAMSPWGDDLWSFSRYTCTLLFGALLFLIVQFIETQHNRISMGGTSAGLLLLFVAASPGLHTIYRTEPWPTMPIRAQTNKLVPEVQGKIPRGALTWYVYQVDDGYRFYLVNYTLAPIRLLRYWEGYFFFFPEALEAPVGPRGSLEAFVDIIKEKGVEYFIVDNPDPKFWERYGALFPSRDHRVYRVSHSPSGEVQLIGM